VAKVVGEMEAAIAHFIEGTGITSGNTLRLAKWYAKLNTATATSASRAASAGVSSSISSIPVVTVGPDSTGAEVLAAVHRWLAARRAKEARLEARHRYLMGDAMRMHAEEAGVGVGLDAEVRRLWLCVVRCKYNQRCVSRCPSQEHIF
jgi:hypothetical protein